MRCCKNSSNPIVQVFKQCAKKLEDLACIESNGGSCGSPRLKNGTCFDVMSWCCIVRNENLTCEKEH